MQPRGVRTQRGRLRGDRLVFLLPGRRHPGVDRRAGHQAALPLLAGPAPGPCAVAPRSRRPLAGPLAHGGRRHPPAPAPGPSCARTLPRDIPPQELSQRLGHHRRQGGVTLAGMLAHPPRQRARQLDGEHHVRLGYLDPPSSHGLLHIPSCLTDRHAVPASHRASGGDDGHAHPDQLGGGIDPPGVLDAIDTTTNHAVNLLPVMTLLTLSARKKFQPPVTQRHLEAEVAHCVGGVSSPLLMNVALHGMEQAAGVRYHAAGHRDAGSAVPGSPVLIRYADDVLAFCHSRQQAEQVKARLADWLAPRGLAFNQDKTRITHLDDGVDFLGCNVRRYHGKLLIKPSKAAVKRVRQRLSAEMKALRGANAEAVLIQLNPIIRGWAAYYRVVVSSKVFNALDDHMWKLTYKWARFGHPNKSRRWVSARYFGVFNTARRDRWVFGDRDSGAYLLKFAWTKIVRHTMVKGGASPDDPTLAGYWAQRRRREQPPLDRSRLRALTAQHGRCPLCDGLLLHADHQPQTPHEWEQWSMVTRTAIRKQAITADTGSGAPHDTTTFRLIHAHCRRRLGSGSGPALLPAASPWGLPEPDAGKA